MNLGDGRGDSAAGGGAVPDPTQAGKLSEMAKREYNQLAQLSKPKVFFNAQEIYTGVARRLIQRLLDEEKHHLSLPRGKMLKFRTEDISAG